MVAPPEKRVSEPLGAFLESYLAGRADLKPATKVVRGQVIRDLNDYFGAERDVTGIQPGDADDFKQWLIGRGLAPTTVHKRLQVARSFFHAMRRRKLISENPFDGVNAVATGNQERQRYVARTEISKVLKACPDHHWRSIVALSRYGGLRCPSEVLSLRWCDVQWDAKRIVVTSPKTEHHAGKASRVIPLFPELVLFLDKARKLAAPESVYVVEERYRKASNGPNGWLNANLRTTFEKIVRRAGLEPWPRLFHNLRASRETELAEQFPIQVVTSWLGNTPKVAMRHYLMTTGEHFERAVQSAVSAAHNPAQQPHAGNRKESQSQLGAYEKNPGNAWVCD